MEEGDTALQYKVITLTAKEKICFCEKPECNPDYCPYAKGHFDRINDAVYDMITTSDDMSRQAVEEQAKKWQVCPFELGLDLSLWADAVICDYNYVFDPNAKLKRFFGEGVKGDYIFLIDEAHNLVERGREMFSASLCKEDVMKVRRLVKTRDVRLARQLEDCNRQLLALKRECDGCQVLESAGGIYLKLLSVMAEMERYLEECQEEDVREEVLGLYFEVRMFETIYEKLDENYMIYSEIDGEGKFLIRLFCVNPAVNLNEALEKGVSTIFFSATLLPIRYYRQLLSTKTDDYAVYAQSTFARENRLLLLGNDVSTRYTARGEATYRKYASYLLEMVQGKKGNYMAFFPSYKFMEEVYDQFLLLAEKEGSSAQCVIQAPYMSEEAREIFLEEFEEEREESLLGFCVMGGIFSEGIDLSRDRLIGAAVVGTGLPQVCRERELLREYFDKKGLRGFDYAYVYPGMNKVLQSAGRVIRTEEDRGVILLLDDRFREPRYKETFPQGVGRSGTLQCEKCRREDAGLLGSDLLEVIEKGGSGPGKRDAGAPDSQQLPRGQLLLGVHDKEIVVLPGDAVVRKKGDAQADPGQVDKQVVAAQLHLRHKVQVVLLELAVEKLACGALLVQHQDGVLQKLRKGEAAALQVREIPVGKKDVPEQLDPLYGGGAPQVGVGRVDHDEVHLP